MSCLGEFQPPDSEEEPEDNKWERWFEQQEKNGYAVISRDEWNSRLNEAATDGYAEGRKDGRREFVLVGWLADDGGAMRAFFRVSEPDKLDEFVAVTEPLEITPLYAAMK